MFKLLRGCRQPQLACLRNVLVQQDPESAHVLSSDSLLLLLNQKYFNPNANRETGGWEVKLLLQGLQFIQQFPTFQNL